MIETVHPGTLGSSEAAVTFWVQCYAHERYVEDSVRSALAQTGPAIEVLISDDASPDRTFDIARSIARGYRGPHRVILFRSAANRGMFAHVDEVVPHLGGRFVVWQSSDDVAAPDRATSLLSAAGAGSGAFSNHRLIDDEGRGGGLGLPADRPFSLDQKDFAEGRCFDFTYGGTLGFTRGVFDRFGPMPARTGGLEHVLAFRAALLGRIAYCRAPLVDRRRHAGSLTVGMGRRDRTGDPLAVHERRAAKRIGILANLCDLAGHAAARPEPGLVTALQDQRRKEAAALEQLKAFRAALQEAADPDAASWCHAARRHDPSALTLVGTCAPGINLLAYQGRYHAVPQAAGAIEPCSLRNGLHAGVVSAWTLAALKAVLVARGTAFELTER